MRRSWTVVVLLVAASGVAALAAPVGAELKVDEAAENIVAKYIDGRWESDRELNLQLEKGPVANKKTIGEFKLDPAALKELAGNKKVTQWLEAGKLFAVGRVSLANPEKGTGATGVFAVAELKGNTCLIFILKGRDGKPDFEVISMVGLARSHNGENDRLIVTEGNVSGVMKRMKDAPAATRPADAGAVTPADLAGVIDDGIKMLEAKDYAGFLRKYLNPTELKAAEEKIGIEELAKQFDEKRAADMIEALRAARGMSPQVSEDGTRVVFEREGKRKLVWVKSAGAWHFGS